MHFAATMIFTLFAVTLAACGHGHGMGGGY
jgi:hypothetical protein